MNQSTDDAAAYDFAAPSQILFGAGRIDALGETVALLGRRVWLVGGGRSLAASGAAARIEASLTAVGIPARRIATTAGEPTVAQVAAALAGVAHESRDGVVVVAVGGGSTIDLAKALAALVTNLPADGSAGGRVDGRSLAVPDVDVPDVDVPDVETAPVASRNADAEGRHAWFDAFVVDRLEGVGRGLPIRNWPLPVVAVPTTAGTGAEATRNAVLSCPRRGFKKSLRSPMMVPRVALVDPDLTASCDRATVAASGLDAITQLIESFVCRFRKPLPRCLVLESLPRALRALPRLLERPAPHDDPTAWHAARATDRAALSHAALLSGMALTNSGLGMAHGVAAALGIASGTPHGLACAVMLPAALRVNRDAACHDFALLERAVDPTAPRADAAAADCFLQRIDRLCLEAGVPRRLSELGVTADQIGWLADHSGGASMRGNPVELSPGAVRDLLAGLL